jgi:hypothetical protein
MPAAPAYRLALSFWETPKRFGRLILLTPLLFTEALAREGFLGAALLTRLHVVTVLFDFFDDVFTLHLTFESPERVLQRLTLLNNNFCQAYSPPFPFLSIVVIGVNSLPVSIDTGNCPHLLSEASR